ncbi:MAG: hypothetical protein EOO20_01860 [Chryseobacterium sp.]|nr:MAG: hypothetical protein EOO20_01860 [Chryseobacterium sp.]
MGKSAVLNFIITDPKDISFTTHVYTSRNFLGEVKPIILHEFEHFYQIFKQAKDNFEFRLIIHAGLEDSGKTMIGEYIITELQSKNELRNIEIYLMTRKADLFGLKYYVVKDSKTTFNSKYLNHDDFIIDFLATAKVYKKGALPKGPVESIIAIPSIGTEETNFLEEHPQPLDFAVITALYEDESTAFLKNSSIDKDFVSSMTNLLRLKFKPQDDADHDFQDNYLLNHAQKMGMVDATFNAAMLLEKYDPKFLIMAGVCGGKEGRKGSDKETGGLKYRDVIIANNIMDIQTGKLEKGIFVPYLLTEELNNQLMTFIEQKKSKIKDRMYSLTDGDDLEFKNHVAAVEIRIGDYGCGSQVINTTNHFKEQITSRNNKALAVEMESYSIYRTCKLHNTLDKSMPNLPIVVKSVMDYTDDNKSDEYKSDAAKMSYLCVRAMMPLLLEFYNDMQKKKNEKKR